MRATSSEFDFTEFAKSIYQEATKTHWQTFILPALYGGELNHMYEALFVLEAPSVSFTEKRCAPCDSVEKAIHLHREIFIDWALRGKQSFIFTALAQMASKDSCIPL